MLSILGNRKIIVSILTMVFLIVGVQGMSYAQANLVVQSIEVNPTSVAPGGNITLTATVRNTGDVASVGALLNYYLSDTHTGQIPGSGDRQVGAVWIGPLSANGGESEVGISLAAESPSLGQNASQTYRYYAEMSGSRRAALLTVTNLQPDLTVALRSYNVYNPTLGYYTPVVPGGAFALEAVVANIGTLRSTATTLTCEYSVDRVNWIDTRVTVNVGAHDPGQSLQSPLPGQVYRVNLIAPSNLNTQFTTGIYYYRVRVTPVSNERNVSDASNYSDSVPITTSSADLIVDRPTVNGSTSVTLGPGDNFTLTAIVRNQGFGPSSTSATLQYYRSTDATISGTDIPEGSAVPIGRTLTGRNATYQGSTDTSTHAVNLTAQTTPGTYYYGVSVSDPANEPHYNTTNNYSAAVTITVSAPPDLVAEILELRPNTVAPGERITLDATVTNDGEGQSPRTTLRFYESVDRRFRDGDEIDSITVAELDSNGSTDESIRWTAPDTPGTYYYRVQVDEVANEEDTFNNTSDYIVLFVEQPLVLESVQPSTSTVAPRESFTLTATLRNDGSTASARTAVEFYRSTDNSITSRDISIGTSFVSAIAARETGQVSLTLTAPTTAGTYYYGVCIGDTTGSDVCMVTDITVVDVSIADFERPPIYWVDADEGTLQSLTDSEIEPFASGIRNANSIAVDMAGDTVYWTEQTGTSTGRIRRADLDGSNVETVRSLNNLPQGIAVDASNGKLYVTNSRGKIQRMNLDGRDYEPNFIIDLDSPGGIAVDAAGGKIYWTEQTGENTGRLQRADLDGSNVESVRSLNNLPYGIAVDASNEKLYVTNSRGKIQRMNLNGRNYEWNFITDLDSPRGIALDVAAGKVYWTEAGSIRRANLNGRNHQDVVTGIGTPAAIALSVAPVNEEAPAAPGAVTANADATALHANYPNPFNPETWIPYQLQHAADVQISIHSQTGVLVRQLSLGYQSAGQYMSRSRAAYWDGRNQLGEPVASGLYFYTLTAGDFSATRRMLILK